MKQRTIAIALLLTLLLLITGCGGTAQPEPDQPPVEEEPSELPEEEPEPVIPMGTNPLTGLPIKLDYVNDRPVAVIFNNLYQAMPQLGISRADLIYEIPVEGGITRMLGVFQSMEEVGLLGTVRSARPCFLETALGHDAIFVHAGGSEQAYTNIRKWDVDNMDGVRGGRDADIFWRDSQRKNSVGYEHSLVTSGENILGYLETSSFRREHEEGYVYDQPFIPGETTLTGEPAEYFELYYSYYKTGRFTYDPETDQYKVVQYSAPYIDGNTGEQLSVTNVLVLNTDIKRVSGDTEGRLEVRLTGSGMGTYFCGGRAIPMYWEKEDRNSPFVYTLTDGNPMTMKQGNSYICIMDPDSSKLTISEQ